jgi:hypothetical protein
MGSAINFIKPELYPWITKQKMFFVATAPMLEDGHVNCSPKGLDSFRILDERTVVYQDLVGSGAETIAHIKDNGRVTIMFCALDGPPKIVRLYGKGLVVLPGDEAFDGIHAQFDPHIGLRSYILLHVERVSESCGYSVPIYEYKHHRDVLDKWAEHKGTEGVAQYIQEKNKESIDGLPALV